MMKNNFNNKKPVISALSWTIKANVFLVVALIITIIGSVALAVVPPLLLEKIVFDLTETKSITWQMGLAYFALIAFGGIFDALKGALITCFGQRITTRLRSMMAEKLTKLPATYFNKNESGKTLSRFTSDVETIDALFKSGIIGMFVDLFKIIFILVAVFTKSIGLGGLLCLATPIVFAVSWNFKTKMRSAQLDNRRAIAKINNHIPETLANARTVHSLKKEAFMEERFHKYVDESYVAFKKTYFYEAIYTPIISEISVIVIALLMTFSAMGGGMQTLFGMGVGTAVAVISYVSKIFSPIENLGMEIQNIQSAFAGIKRVEEFFGESEKKEQIYFSLNSIDETSDAVCFENVSFAYDDGYIFKNVSFSVKRGESVAFVGRTGAGKTTVYRLILGLYSPTDGCVKVFGVPSDEIADGLKRKIFGYVEQSVRLVHGDIMEQITLGDKNLTEDEVVDALKTVGLYETVQSFSNGIHTKCDESLFSQGQLQLLSVARAIVCDPMILLLDEITANLDSETEKCVSNAIKKAESNRTVLNISHRLGDIREGTKIIDITKLSNLTNEK